MTPEEWKRQAKEMEAMAKEVEGVDDRVYLEDKKQL